MSEVKKETIFLVDDDNTNLETGRTAIKEGNYTPVTIRSGKNLLETLEKIPEEKLPDLILLDIEMPDMNGYETIKALKKNPKIKDIPVIFLTGNKGNEDEYKGLDLGAVDYITKPFSTKLLLKRIEMHLLASKNKKELQEKVDEQTKTIKSLQDAILETMAELVEERDKFTGGHILRTAEYLKVLIDGMEKQGVYLDEISKWDIPLVLQSALLHDLGKISIEDDILNKPGQLNPGEKLQMDKHTSKGVEAIDRISQSLRKKMEHTGEDPKFLEYAKIFAATHHEQWDDSNEEKEWRKGYPGTYKGKDIPLLGRLMAIADVYDALVSERPYKGAMTYEEAEEIILKGKGTHFDPILVDVFEKVSGKFKETAAKYKEKEGAIYDPAKEGEKQRLRREIKSIAQKIEKVANGDLDIRFEYTGTDVGDFLFDEMGNLYSRDNSEPFTPQEHENYEIAYLSCSLNSLVYNLKRMIESLIREIYKNGIECIDGHDNKYDENSTKGINLWRARWNWMFEISEYKYEEPDNNYDDRDDFDIDVPDYALKEEKAFWILEVEEKEQHDIFPIPKCYGGLMDLFKYLMEHAVEVRLREKDDIQDTIRDIGGISHDITPLLGCINDDIECIENEDMPLNARNHIQSVVDASTQVQSFFKTILELSKSESGKLENDPENYLLSDLVHSVISTIKTKFKKKTSLTFFVNIDGNIPNMFYGDKNKLWRVLFELLNNAVKYTEEGSISLDILWNFTTKNDVALTIKIKDSGKGIKKEDQEKIFEPGVRVDSDNNRGIDGYGRGLDTVKKNIELMDKEEGEISVDSEYGKGSVFTVKLRQQLQLDEYSRIGNLSYKRFASVDNPEKTSILVYHDGIDKYIDSVMESIFKLGVHCEHVSTEDDFYKKMKNGWDKGTFSFVFAVSALVRKVRDTCAELKSSVTVVSLAVSVEEAITDENPNVLSMPAYTLTIANLLNRKNSESENKNTIVKPTVMMPDVKVLIVDDDAGCRERIKSKLLPYRMQVDTCERGEEAIERVKKETYDLIFMDHQMRPGEMDGIETAKSIRDLDCKNCHELRFVALTGNADKNTKKLFMRNDFDGFLSKNINRIDLEDILKKLIPAEKQAEYVEKNDEAATPTGSEVVIDGIDMDSNEIKMGIPTLKAFYDTWSKDLIKIHRALEANDDMQGYTSYIHKLKGASGAIGATALFKDAERLEAAGKMKDQEVIGKCNPRLLSKLESLLSNIDDYLKAVDDDCVGATDTEVLKSGLTELKQAIYDYDFDIIGTVTEKIQPFERTENIGVTVKDILECIRGGKYGDTTIRLIDDLLSSV